MATIPADVQLDASNECIRHGLDHSAAWAGLGQGVQMPQLGNEIIDGPVLCHGLRANLSDNGHVGRDGKDGPPSLQQAAYHVKKEL